MEPEDVVVPNGLLARVLLDVAQAREVVENLAIRPSIGCGQLATLVERAHLIEGEPIALDGGGGVGVASARVLLERGNPRHLDGGALDAFPQGRDRFHEGEETQRDGELRDVAHAISQS